MYIYILELTEPLFVSMILTPKASAPERAAGQEGAGLQAQRAGKRLGPQAREGRML